VIYNSEDKKASHSGSKNLLRNMHNFSVYFGADHDFPFNIGL
jgi:hypothetical protein